MKHIAVGVYALLVLFCGAWMISSYIGNRGVSFSWRPDGLAFTFIPMTLFAISILVLQINRPMSWWLMGQAVLVGVPLLVASIYHMFPEKSTVAATAHLLLAVVFFLINVATYLKPSS
jgi:hypothetical protein